MTRFVLATALACLSLGTTSACLTLDSFAFSPIPTDRYLLEDPTVPPALREEVTLTASDGVTLYGVFARQPNPERTVTILYFHGNAANIDYYWKRASLLWAMGANVFVFDYRGFGRSQGKPTEEGLYRDAEAARKFIESRKDIDPAKVAYYGYSLGGALAIDTASKVPPRWLVTESTFTSMVDIAQDGSLVLPASFGLQARFASVEKIARAGAPVLLMHGLADDFVQPKYVDKLYDAAVEPKTKVVFPPSNHDGVPFDESAKYRSTVQGFLGLLPTP